MIEDKEMEGTDAKRIFERRLSLMAYEELAKTTSGRLAMAMATAFSGYDDLFKPVAPKRGVKTLKAAFKAANRRVSKSIARYVNLIHSLWAENASGELVQASYLCLTFKNDKWHVREYITDSYDSFYRRGKGKKRHAEIGGSFKLVPCKPVAFSEVKKLETALEAAIERRETLIDELAKVGVDVWKDDDLW